MFAKWWVGWHPGILLESSESRPKYPCVRLLVLNQLITLKFWKRTAFCINLYTDDDLYLWFTMSHLKFWPNFLLILVLELLIEILDKCRLTQKILKECFYYFFWPIDLLRLGFSPASCDSLTKFWLHAKQSTLWYLVYECVQMKSS